MRQGAVTSPDTKMETDNHSPLIDIYICRLEPNTHDIDHSVEQFLDESSSERFPKRIDGHVWDFFLATTHNWIASGDIDDWLKTKAENIGRHIAIRVHDPKAYKYRVFSPHVEDREDT